MPLYITSSLTAGSLNNIRVISHNYNYIYIKKFEP